MKQSDLKNKSPKEVLTCAAERAGVKLIFCDDCEEIKITVPERDFEYEEIIHVPFDEERLIVPVFHDNLYNVIKRFDISEETYAFLDDEGHGINGLPYDMKDCYNDFRSILKKLIILYDEIK